MKNYVLYIIGFAIISLIFSGIIPYIVSRDSESKAWSVKNIVIAGTLSAFSLIMYILT